MTIRRWIPSLFLIGVIYILSATPGKTLNEAGLGPEVYHVGGHFIMFFFLSLTFYYATRSIKKALILTFLYAVLDELHQLDTPGRTASTKDIIVDTLAGTSAGGLVWILYPKIPEKLRKLLEI